ncbi:hypothetical protein DV515_00008085 [Chloebia gouldiae]|uniref:Uncharacterized protein n=1 Tax=Chloebia gouldiae TaxID=44316 RepID=A0A3L8SF37_CHLGU|nr:hypothetical protein DV515_00008085 [Chloebia gouldiae]
MLEARQGHNCSLAKLRRLEGFLPVRMARAQVSMQPVIPAGDLRFVSTAQGYVSKTQILSQTRFRDGSCAERSLHMTILGEIQEIKPLGVKQILGSAHSTPVDFGCWASKSPKAVGGSGGQDTMPSARASPGVQAFPNAKPEVQAMPGTLVALLAPRWLRLSSLPGQHTVLLRERWVSQESSEKTKPPQLQIIEYVNNILTRSRLASAASLQKQNKSWWLTSVTTINLILISRVQNGIQRGDAAKQAGLLPSLGVKQREELALPCSQQAEDGTHRGNAMLGLTGTLPDNNGFILPQPEPTAAFSKQSRTGANSTS